MAPEALRREIALERIRSAEPALRALGIARLALFGSTVRDEALPNSDVDVLIQFTEGAKSYARFLAVAELLEALLGRRVDLVTTEGLSPFLGPRIQAEAVDVLRAA